MCCVSHYNVVFSPNGSDVRGLRALLEGGVGDLTPEAGDLATCHGAAP
jgi:hypothetical protein